MITYYVKDKVLSAKDERKKAEEKLKKDGKDSYYPPYDQLAKERDEEKPNRFLIIKDESGNLVRQYSIGADKVGWQRLSWDLRSMDRDPVSTPAPSFYNPFSGKSEGPLVAPGKYTVSMAVSQNGELKAIGNTETITVKPIDNKSLPPKDAIASTAFKKKVEDVARVQTAVSSAISDALAEISEIRRTLGKLETPQPMWLKEAISIETKLEELERRVDGDPIQFQLDMDPTPSISARLGKIIGEGKYSSSDPTGTHQASLAIAKEELVPVVNELKVILEKDLPDLRKKLQEAGAPYTPNVIPIFNVD